MSAIKKTEHENSEALFHDRWAESIDVQSINLKKYFESAFSPENQQILKWMGSIRGQSLLDLGCGAGEASVYFALKGARVTATDISFGMLKKTSELAKQHHTSLKVQLSSATDLSAFEDESFDIIYAANLLHHVEIKQCISEVYKKLKVGGTAYFWDPILYNPAIQVYRRLAKDVRTKDEHPLTIEDFEALKNIFTEVEIKHHWLFGLSIFFKYFLIDRLNPNTNRYWKIIFNESQKTENIIRLFHKIDQTLFRYIPAAKWLSWNVSIRLKK